MTMRKTVLAVLAAVAGVAAGFRALAGAAEASVSLDVASAYVFRGATLNDGLVVQPGLEVSGLPVTLGVWGNLDIDDYDGALDDGQFSEIDLYGSYALPIETFDLSVGYTEYAYPSGGEADREFSLSAGLDALLAPTIAVYYGVDGAIEEALYVEAAVGHELALSENASVGIGATLAYLSPDQGDSGFSHFTASLAASYGVVSASLTYVGQLDDDVLPDVDDGGPYDVDLYATIGVSHEF